MNLSAAWRALEQLAQVLRESKEGWYLDVHQLRWMATAIDDVATFEEHIAPKISSHLNNAHNYATCVAMTLSRFIEDPNAPRELRERALLGNESQHALAERITRYSKEKLLGNETAPGLIHLIFCQHQRNLMAVVEQAASGFGLQDSFWNTRHVAVQQLIRLVSDVASCATYRDISLQALQARCQLLAEKGRITPQQRSELDQELQSLHQRKEVLKETTSDLQGQFDSLNAQIAKRSETREREKNRADEAKKEELEEALASSQQQLQNVSDQCVEKAHHLDQLEEQEYLQEALKSLGLDC